MKKIYFIIIILLILTGLIHAELKFNPLSLNKKNEYIFNTIELIAGKEFNKTLFYGKQEKSKYTFEAISFYPEYLFYSDNDGKLFIQNRMGLYCYDINKKEVSKLENYPNIENGDEYIITKLNKVDFSPNFRYILGMKPISSVKADIYLYDTRKNIKEKIISGLNITPGKPIGLWSNNSKYFIYQKGEKTYYFSINDYKRDKLLSEDYRYVGNVSLENIRWTSDDQLIWIEKNLIYKADSRQFYSRSIYKKYLRLGEIIGKIPFSFDSAFDSFRYNESSQKFIIAKDYSSIYYYSLSQTLKQNPYLLLNETMRFKDAYIFDDGNGILLIDVLNNGIVNKKIIILKKEKDRYNFIFFEPEILNNILINNIALSNNKKKFVVNTAKGAYCFNFKELSQAWFFDKEEVINSINTDANEWIIGGKYITYKAIPEKSIYQPIFASSFQKAGFFIENIGISANNSNYILDTKSKTLKEYKYADFELDTKIKNESHRLITREIKKGFYTEGLFIKDLYTGELTQITIEPKLNYTLYQPELELGVDYYNDPSKIKYEIAIVFDCINSSEGVFPILQALDRFKIKSTFFINGIFMNINPEITKEITNFDIEIGNMFQYYVNLTDNDYLIDKNFIRQGLSANEEKFYKLTGYNFSPIWHSPEYAYNESIIKYGKESGYKFVTFNLDSLDWVGETDAELKPELFMDSSQIIERILKNVKPGYIIVFSTGKNDSVRNNWLFNNFDLLISELVRNGYGFTNVSDLLKKYRNEK